MQWFLGIVNLVFWSFKIYPWGSRPPNMWRDTSLAGATLVILRKWSPLDLGPETSRPEFLECWPVQKCKWCNHSLSLNRAPLSRLDILGRVRTRALSFGSLGWLERQTPQPLILMPTVSNRQLMQRKESKMSVSWGSWKSLFIGGVTSS